MEINLQDMTISFGGKTEDIYELAKKISTKDVSKVVELLNETNSGMPRILRTRALKMVLNEFVKIAKDLPITTELLHRLNWYTEYSDYQLNKLFNTLANSGDTRFHENACAEQYKISLWILILVNAQELNLTEDTIKKLNKIDDVHTQFEEYNELLNGCLYDFDGSIDVIPGKDFSRVMFKSSTVAELREVAAKYDINVPKRLNRAQLLEVIIQRLKEDEKYDEAVHEKIKDMKVVSLQRFAKDNDIKASTELRKDAVIDFILKAVDNGQTSLKTNVKLNLIVLDEEQFEMKPEYIRDIDSRYYYEFDEDGEIVSKSDINDLKGEIDKLREEQEAERVRLNIIRMEQEAAQNEVVEDTTQEDLYAERVRELEKQIEILNNKQSEENDDRLEDIINARIKEMLANQAQEQQTTETVVVETVVEEYDNSNENEEYAGQMQGRSIEGNPYGEEQQDNNENNMDDENQNVNEQNEEYAGQMQGRSIEGNPYGEEQQNEEETTETVTTTTVVEEYVDGVDTSEKEAELAQKEAELAETAAQKETELAEKEAELVQAAAEKEAELAAKEAELAEKEAEKEAELAQKEAELAQAAAEKEAELAEKEAELAQKEAEKEVELVEKEAERDAELAAKEAALAEKEAELAQAAAEKEAELAAKEAELAEKEAELQREADARREAEFAQREAELAQRELEIQKEAEFAQKEAELAQKEVDMHKELEYAQKEAEFAQREAELQRQAELAAKEAGLAQRETELEREAELLAKEAELAAKENDLQRQSELAAKEAELAAKEAELERERNALQNQQGEDQYYETVVVETQVEEVVEGEETQYYDDQAVAYSETIISNEAPMYSEDIVGQEPYSEEVVYSENIVGQEPYSEEVVYSENIVGQEPYSEEIVYSENIVGQEPYSEEVVYQEAPIYSENIVYQEDPSVYSEEVVYQEAPIYSENIVYQEDPSVYSEEVVYQEAPIYSENIVYQEDPSVYSEEVVYQEAPIYSENIVYQDNPSVYSEEIVYQEAPIYSENIVYQEEPIYSENVVYQEAPIYSENIVYQQNPVYQEQTVYSEEVVYQQPQMYQEQTVYSEEVVYQQPQMYQEQTVYSEEVVYNQNNAYAQDPYAQDPYAQDPYGNTSVYAQQITPRVEETIDITHYDDPYQNLPPVETVEINQGRVDEVSFISYAELNNYSQSIYEESYNEPIETQLYEEVATPTDPIVTNVVDNNYDVNDVVISEQHNIINEQQAMIAEQRRILDQEYLQNKDNTEVNEIGLTEEQRVELNRQLQDQMVQQHQEYLEKLRVLEQQQMELDNQRERLAEEEAMNNISSETTTTTVVESTETITSVTTQQIEGDDRTSRFQLMEEKISNLTSTGEQVQPEINTPVPSSFDAEHLNNLFESNGVSIEDEKPVVNENAGELVDETSIVDTLDFVDTPMSLSNSEIDESLLTKKQLKAKKEIAKLEKEKAKVLNYRTMKDSKLVKKYKRGKVIKAIKIVLVLVLLIAIYLFVALGGIHAANTGNVLFEAWSFSATGGFGKFHCDVLDVISFGNTDAVIGAFGKVYDLIFNFLDPLLNK